MIRCIWHKSSSSASWQTAFNNQFRVLCSDHLAPAIGRGTLMTDGIDWIEAYHHQFADAEVAAVVEADGGTLAVGCGSTPPGGFTRVVAETPS